MQVTDAVVGQAPVVDQGPAVPVGPTDGAVPAVSTPLPHDGNRRSVCYGDQPCGKDLFCYAPTGGGRQYPGVCTDGCRTDANCPPVDGLPQVCFSNGQCRVDCGGAENKGSGPCPVNQICRDVRSAPLSAPIWSCTYPDNSGSRAAPMYGPCSTTHGSADCAAGNVCHVPSVALTLPTRTPTLPVQAPVVTSGYCTNECASAMDCALTPGITAMPVCTRSRCELDCGAAGANTCPDKMNCRDIDDSPLAATYRCVFIN